MTPATAPRRLRRPAAWLLAMCLPVGIVAGASNAFATGPDYLVDTDTILSAYDPQAVAVDASGNVFVADGASVQRFAPGETQGTVIAGDVSEGKPSEGLLDHPAGLALSSDGKTLYIADRANHVVVTADATASAAPAKLTVLIGTEGVAGAPTNGATSLLRNPTGVAVDGSGNVYVADSGNNQVEKYTAAGKTLTVFAGTGTAASPVAGPANRSPLNGPSAVALDVYGNLLVADAANHSVDRVDPSGNLSVLGSTGPSSSVTSLAVDLAGSVFVTDPAAGTIQRIVPGGAPKLVTVDSAPVAPTAVATNASGYLWVADSGSITELHPSAQASAPRITSAAPTKAAVKTTLVHRFTATGTPTAQWSFVDQSVPAWLSLNAGTGVLTATPDKAGTVTFTVRATNGEGHDDQVVTLTVGTLPAAPAAPTAVAGDGRAVVTWKPAAAAGTTATDVTGYSLTPYKDGVAQAPVTFTATQPATQVVTGLTNGAKYTFTLAATNSFGTGTASAVSTAVTPYATVKKPVLDVPVSRLSGKDRIETAVNSSKALFPTTGSAGSVVVSAAWKYADALAGARLASATSAPLLLTESDKLSASVGTEISRVLAPGGTIYVLGGSGTVSSGVETALAGLSPNYVVKRLSGDDRYDTAAKITGEVAAQAPGTGTAPIYLASGVNFPDGLAVSALAARTGGVVLLTDATVLPAATKAYLQAVDPNGARVVPVGGAAAEAAKALPAAGGSATRAIVGVDRFDTANLVARRFTTGTPTKVVGVATGDTWPDALVGASAVGLMGGPLLLTSGADLSASARSALAALNAAKPLATGVVFGGQPSVPAAAYASFGSFVAQD
ncbi:cell wall-binding repeat-containing protein [Kineococcus rhizosphaerae]|uniref:Fibronectin type III domain protein n=1 Tax=Kineococcus rhizosphaerae TaxID=559628 RepID=A0A2T0R2C4_9ACTN|nr:cell wall-binding repeat-containing protein [Kineococcus rhizosphaerae]PRY13934.1 fibronectin type III domain protein [Kineococcus rhizosphaerae]